MIRYPCQQKANRVHDNWIQPPAVYLFEIGGWSWSWSKQNQVDIAIRQQNQQQSKWRVL